MRMDCSGRNKKAVPGMQCNGRLAFFLPDARAGQNPEGNRGQMEVPRVDSARGVLRIPDNYLFVRRARKNAF
jgi:hypothetical protein